MPSNKSSELTFLRNIGIVMTYRCQVACPHCIIEAGPHRREEVSLDEAFSWIEQIANYRNGHVRVLSLTGGEPFYNVDNLGKISSFAKAHGLLVTVVTNAFWAQSKGEAVRILKELPAIRIFAFSTDVYHQESIPIERIENAVYAAKECNVPYYIHVCTENKDDAEYKKTMDRLQEFTGIDDINTAVTFPVGRALKKLGTLNYQTSEEPPMSACSSSGSPILFPDGRVIACIGPVIDLLSSHPLALGNLREDSLDEILDRAERNPILHAIRVWGPKKLISIIREAGLDQHLSERYVKDSVCNACYDLMSNGRIVEFLAQLAEDPEFKQMVAYARVHYMNETRMAEDFQLAASN